MPSRDDQLSTGSLKDAKCLSPLWSNWEVSVNTPRLSMHCKKMAEKTSPAGPMGCEVLEVIIEVDLVKVQNCSPTVRIHCQGDTASINSPVVLLYHSQGHRRTKRFTAMRRRTCRRSPPAPIRTSPACLAGMAGQKASTPVGPPCGWLSVGKGPAPGPPPQGPKEEEESGCIPQEEWEWAGWEDDRQ